MLRQTFPQYPIRLNVTSKLGTSHTRAISCCFRIHACKLVQSSLACSFSQRTGAINQT